MPRRSFVMLALILVSCSGADAARPAARSSAAAVRTTSASRVVTTRAPATKLASGTDFASGVLISWCERRCDRDARAVPERYLKGQENGLLVFQVAAAPRSARVEILDRAGRVFRSGDLTPGTTMAYVGRLGRGRFSVVLVARWGEREGRWLFGLDGPLGS